MNAHRQRYAFKRELVWVLISILLFLYAATSYVFWAKTGSAWLLFR